MTPDEERAAIGKTLDALEQASGIRALGWATPAYSWTEHTFDLLLQAGVRWYADALDISLPRKQKTASGDIVAFPWSDFVDNRVLRGAPRVHSKRHIAGTAGQRLYPLASTRVSLSQRLSRPVPQ
jgi:peptidoglycan/xylan/chitin deacetylase (PgdA/CDA1 family)